MQEQLLDNFGIEKLTIRKIRFRLKIKVDGDGEPVKTQEDELTWGFVHDYYDDVEPDGVLQNPENVFTANGWTYFPHEECFFAVGRADRKHFPAADEPGSEMMFFVPPQETDEQKALLQDGKILSGEQLSQIKFVATKSKTAALSAYLREEKLATDGIRCAIAVINPEISDQIVGNAKRTYTSTPFKSVSEGNPDPFARELLVRDGDRFHTFETLGASMHAMLENPNTRCTSMVNFEMKIFYFTQMMVLWFSKYGPMAHRFYTMKREQGNLALLFPEIVYGPYYSPEELAKRAPVPKTPKEIIAMAKAEVTH